jgi:hypothetical protein
MAVVRKLQPTPSEPESRKLSEHDLLCELGRKWLLRPHSARGPGCIVALREMSTIYGGESPDALGWRSGKPWAGSYLVEVKTSRSDFLGDKKKVFRQQPDTGVGNWRFYLCPEGLISIEDLPEGWGLMWVNSRGQIKPIRFPHIDRNMGRRERNKTVEACRFVSNRDQEMMLFLAALRGDADPQDVLDQRRETRQIAARIQALLNEERGKHLRTKNQLAELMSRNLKLEAQLDDLQLKVKLAPEDRTGKE